MISYRRIKIGVARKTYSERYPAHITKVSGRRYFEIWEMTNGGGVLAAGTLEEIQAWAKENGYMLTPTNRLGKSIITK